MRNLIKNYNLFYTLNNVTINFFIRNYTAGNVMKRAREHLLKSRCSWATENDLLKYYHDEEWGVPVHNDKKHFEMLILEGAQAGINWLTILKKRENYRRCFRGFDPDQVARMSDKELDECLKDEGIIRSRLKIYSVRKNAIEFLNIQKEFGSFDQYIWKFIDNQQIVNKSESTDKLLSETEESKKISNDLKKRGMKFVGSKIIYAYMQAVGLVNGHSINCFCYRDCSSFKKKDFHSQFQSDFFKKPKKIKKSNKKIEGIAHKPFYKSK